MLGPRPIFPRLDPPGLLVVGHGTADPVGAREAADIAAAVSGLLPGLPVELGYLEVIRPSIAEAMDRLAARGCRRVVAAPMLLFSAGHARRDVPEAVLDAAQRAGVTVCQADPFGCHPDIVSLSRRRRIEAVAGLRPVAAGETLLVVVGRGASDPETPAQLRDFIAASMPTADPPMLGVELGFVAAARPTLADACAAAAAAVDRGCRRVIVQPHLLFRGHVEEQVTAAVDRARRSEPRLEWVQAGRLGADQLVARALVDRAAEAAWCTEAGQAGSARQGSPAAS